MVHNSKGMRGWVVTNLPPTLVTRPPGSQAPTVTAALCVFPEVESVHKNLILIVLQFNRRKRSSGKIRDISEL